MTSILQFMKSPRPKSTTDESSVSNKKSIRPEARSVRVQSADIVPANAGGEEGILLDKEHTTKVHPTITYEVRNSTPSDQDLIDAPGVELVDFYDGVDHVRPPNMLTKFFPRPQIC